jgi:hypothetical protein
MGLADALDAFGGLWTGAGAAVDTATPVWSCPGNVEGLLITWFYQEDLMTRSARRRFTDDFKQEAVRLYFIDFPEISTRSPPYVLHLFCVT